MTDMFNSDSMGTPVLWPGGNQIDMTPENSGESATEQSPDDELLLAAPIDEDLINRRLLEVESQLSRLTDAVNQFGQMLDYIVNSVQGMSSMVQEKGLMGILQSAMGGGK
jgi:hypothetical protein